MAQYEAENNGLGVNEMLATLIARTWKAPRLTGTKKLIQLQTEQVLLTYLLSASINDNNSFAVKAALSKSLKDLKTFVTAQSKAVTDEIYKGHLLLTLERMEKPENAKPTIHKEIPPGAPIGCDWEDQ
jgi:hypothetical protein